MGTVIWSSTLCKCSTHCHPGLHTAVFLLRRAGCGRGGGQLGRQQCRGTHSSRYLLPSLEQKQQSSRYVIAGRTEGWQCAIECLLKLQARCANLHY